MKNRMKPNHVLLAVLVVLFAIPAAGSAQRVLSLGLGAGVGVGEARNGADGSHAHGLAYLELKPPLLPFGIRGDGFLIGQAGEAGALGYALSGVLSLPVPLITPYGIAGWGRYGLPDNEPMTGWHVGAGLRVSVGGPAIFAEVKRHQRFSRELLTVGMRF